MSDASAKVTPLRKPRPCPECGQPSARATFPFCSERCKSVDLNRWLTGAYAIPVREEEEAESRPDEADDGAWDKL
ncbi:DNA gyrase inhibitor YacG [Pararhizobium haloflavum]|uniref:DNA gyrase inhibitor YacG n=1 Tax=Pararhizobium haloflavum TaxID=2037914 RepID=UPI000C1A49A1|nr:DNA gyrase inhibitor YacG [Pararhizobium haloflavum]